MIKSPLAATASKHLPMMGTMKHIFDRPLWYWMLLWPRTTFFVRIQDGYGITKRLATPHLQSAEHPHLRAQHRHLLALKESSDARLNNYGRNPLSFRHPMS